MSIMFIADIHLCIQEPKITSSFLHFLRVKAISAEALYILGDLFEEWIGDDDSNPLSQEIASALKFLTQQGISCYFIHGNRDFLLGDQYAANCGMTLLPAQQVIQLNGLKIILLHGDILCTDDSCYQQFRHQVRKRWLQRIFLSLPLVLRRQIANKIRFSSIRNNIRKMNNIMDVNAKTVITLMDIVGATIMIHGHTHQPAIHCLPGKRYRIVLSSWYDQGSAIEVSPKGFVFHKFPLKDKNY